MRASSRNLLKVMIPFVAFISLSTTGHSENKETLDTAILAKMAKLKIPGLAAAAINSGRVVWIGTYGWANIEKQKLIKGGRNADAFIIARAHAIGGTVVTMERFKPNAVKIPNICEHFKVPYLDLEGFMEAEGWEF